MNEETSLNIMLTLAKNTSEILYHGSIESADKNVLKCFSKALVEMIKVKDEIFKLMQEKGYYKLNPVKESKKDEIKSKYSQNKMD